MIEDLAINLILSVFALFFGAGAYVVIRAIYLVLGV